MNGVKHIYALSGSTVLSEEWTESGVQHLIIYAYDTAGSPIGMLYRNSTYLETFFDSYLFGKNIQGDILYIYDRNGNRLVSYTYDAWGNILSTVYSNGGASTSARFNPFRYRGYYYDAETGLYYLNSRYYDPIVGRFINANGYISTGQGLLGYNMFTYCRNNPVMFFDPFGNCPHTLLGNDCIDCLSGDYTGTIDPSITAKTEGLSSKYIDFGLAVVDFSESALSGYYYYELTHAIRPANIGLGTFNKEISYGLSSLNKWNKIYGKISGVLGVSTSVGFSIYDNVASGAPFKKIAVDAVVDGAICAGTIWASGALGSKIGAAAGTSLTPAGTIIGAGVGFIAGIVIDCLATRIKINGRSASEWVKYGLYQVF